MSVRRVGSIQNELLAKSKEAALNAVAIYNNPTTTFKSESFIVLMAIAWMYLMHAHYRREGIDYRYFTTLPSGRKRYDRTKRGAEKHWELERCLNDDACPFDNATRANLRFLIGLRHEIEHQICLDLDDAMAGRYLAACLNYEAALVRLFGTDHSLDKRLGFTLQFRDLFQPAEPAGGPRLPSSVARFIQEFDADLSDEDYASQSYQIRLLFTQKTANRKGQADRILEFVPAGSELAQAIEKQHWVLKEVERPKFRPKDVVETVNSKGFPRFNMHHHTELWKRLDARSLAKGYGVEVSGQWYWYERWIELVREECHKNAELYGPVPELQASA